MQKKIPHVSAWQYSFLILISFSDGWNKTKEIETRSERGQESQYPRTIFTNTKHERRAGASPERPAPTGEGWKGSWGEDLPLGSSGSLCISAELVAPRRGTASYFTSTMELDVDAGMCCFSLCCIIEDNNFHTIIAFSCTHMV